ncbi:MAG TPA: hypothetical protein VHQ86_04915 [Candidatus Saccharimonadia bacterium]|jgi:hypothetical protein|nr:hypothetical protein [Candidatus Saccharimonadia bacterium]
MDVLNAVLVVGVPIVLATAGVVYSRRGDRAASIARRAELFRERMANFDRWQSDAAGLAASYYGIEKQDPLAPLLVRSEWVPARPVPLDEVKVRLVPAGPVDVAPKEMMYLLPSRTNGKRFRHFSHAIQELKVRPPEMFRDLPSYALEAAEMEGGVPALSFSLGTYFEFIDNSEALGFEFVTVVGRRKKVELKKLRYRAGLGDPKELGSRRIISSINVVTVRVDSKTKASTFFLLKRSEKVASESGLYGTIPAGMFQPASAAPTDIKDDLDLWRTIQREYNEEFLGAPDAVGSSGTSIDYDHDEPYRTFREGIKTGKMRGYYMGFGLDPLTLSAKLCAAVVFDGDFFDKTFSGMVHESEEGALVAKKKDGRLVGLPLTKETIDDFEGNIRMGAGAEAAVRATLHHLNDLVK